MPSASRSALTGMQRRRWPPCRSRSQVVLTRPLEDRAVDMAAAAAAGNLHAQAAKLRLDVGWSLWAQGGGGEDEEEEETQLEFSLAGGLGVHCWGWMSPLP